MDLKQLAIKFSNVAKEYWQTIESTRLYNTDDFEVLTEWGMVGKSGPLSGWNKAMPSEMIDSGFAKWSIAVSKHAQHIALLHRLAFDVVDGCLANNAPSDKTLLCNAVSELGLPEAMKKAHEVSPGRIRELIPNSLSLVLGKMQHADYIGDESTVRLILAKVVSSMIAQRIIDTSFGLQVPEFMGGLCKSPGFWDTSFLDTAANILPILDEETNVDFGRLEEILSKAYTDCIGLDAHRRDIDGWLATARDIVREGRNGKVRITVAVEAAWQQMSSALDLFESALRDVDEIRSMGRAIQALNAPLGFSDLAYHSSGRIRLPVDTVVVAVHATEGQFAEIDLPILTMEHRYRRQGQAFVNAETMSALGLGVGQLLEMEASPNVDSATRVMLLAHAVEVAAEGTWKVTFDVFPAISLWKEVEETRGLPNYVAIQDRLADDAVGILTLEQCRKAAALLPSTGIVSMAVRPLRRQD